VKIGLNTGIHEGKSENQFETVGSMKEKAAFVMPRSSVAGVNGVFGGHWNWAMATTNLRETVQNRRQ